MRELHVMVPQQAHNQLSHMRGARHEGSYAQTAGSRS